MADERLEFLISLGLDDATAKKAVSSLDAMQKGLKDTQRQAEETKKKFQQLSEQGEKLASVGAAFAGLGASILAPLTLAAAAYTEKFKGIEKQATAFAAAQQRSADATTRLGRQAATALLPTLERISTIAEKVAEFAERNPALVDAAINAGSALAAGGGALAAIGTAQNVIGKLGQLVGSGGLASGAANAVVAIAALGAGAKGAELLLNKVGEASGDAYLAQFKLSDALETARKIIGAIVLKLAEGIGNAYVTIGRIVDGLAGALMLGKNNIELALLELGDKFLKFSVAIAEILLKLGIISQKEFFDTTIKAVQGTTQNDADRKRIAIEQGLIGGTLAGNDAERQKSVQEFLKGFASSVDRIRRGRRGWW
jgi:hypothetical protein